MKRLTGLLRLGCAVLLVLGFLFGQVAPVWASFDETLRNERAALGASYERYNRIEQQINDRGISDQQRSELRREYAAEQARYAHICRNITDLLRGPRTEESTVNTSGINTNTNLSGVNWSNMGSLIEQVRDLYGQGSAAVQQALTQIMQGPNPDLPGVWSDIKPHGRHGDMYDPYDRIIDDLGDEYVKQPDGGWEATGENFGPSSPPSSAEGGETTASSAPQPQPGDAAQEPPDTTTDPTGTTTPPPTAPQDGQTICDPSPGGEADLSDLENAEDLQENTDWRTLPQSFPHKHDIR